MGEDISLGGDERIELSKKIHESVGDNTEAVRDDRRIRAWLYDEFPITKDFEKGAGNVRACGRLAFQYSVEDFRRCVHDAAVRATHPASKRAVLEIFAMQTRETLAVYIVCSLLGGTGSGSFLEVAYNAREALRDLGLATSFVGFLLIGVNGLDDIHKANCYGALKELEYFSASELSPSNLPFQIDYPVPGGLRIDVKERPFDYCYLVNWVNEAGRTFPGEQPQENIARNILLEFSPGLSERRDAMRVDMFGTGGAKELDPKLKRFQGFSACGLSVLEFPAVRIRDMLANHLAAHATGYWLFQHAPDLKDITGTVRAIVQQHRLGEKEMVTDLLNVNGNDLRTTVARGLSTSQKEIEDLIDSAVFDKTAILNAVDKSIRENHYFVNFDHDPQKCGMAVKDINGNKRRQLAEVVTELKDNVARMVGNPHEGPKNALDLVNSLISSLKINSENLTKQIAASEEKARSADAVVTETRRKLARDLSPNFRTEVKHFSNQLHREALLNYLTTCLLRESYRSANHLLAVDRTEEGVTEFSLLSELESLKIKIEAYRKNLLEVSERFAKDRDAKRANLLSEPITAGFRLSKERLTAVEKDTLPNLEQEAHQLLGEVQNAFGEKDPEGRPIRPKPLFLVMTDDFDRAGHIIIQHAQKRCDVTRNYSIARELAGIRDLPDIIENCIAQSRVMLSTVDIQHETSHFPAKNAYWWIATASRTRDPDVNAIIQQAAKSRNGYRVEDVLADPYQIIFAEELAIFPLRCVRVLAEYKKSYLNVLKQTKVPRQTDKRIEFPDLLPPPPEMKRIRDHTGEAFLLGRILGYLEEAEDPETKYPAIFLRYDDPKSRSRVYQRLGERWDGVEDELFRRQVAKEIDRVDTMKATPLEKLEELCKAKASEAKSRPQKEQLWLDTQAHLDRLREECDGGERNPEYQRQLAIIQGFRDRYQLQAADRREIQFRSQIRKRLDKGPALETESERTLVQWGMEFCELTEAEASRILDSEIQARPQTGIEDRRETYRRLLRMATEDGLVDASERAVLKKRQKVLGLSDEEVRQIEVGFEFRETQED